MSTVTVIAQTGIYILASLGGSGLIIFGFSNWLGKIWAERLMEKEKDAHNRALALLQNDLRKIAFESETKFAKLHEKRAEVTAQVYASLVAFVRAADGHLIGPRVNEDKAKLFRECEEAFRDGFEPNEIYFPKELCDALSEFSEKLRRSDLQKSMDSAIFEANAPRPQEVIDRMNQRWNLVTEEVPLLKKKLIDDFRKLLGDEPVKQ